MAKTFFLGMGQGKAGSSWLYDYLVSHPQVEGGCLKEMHTLDFPEYHSILKSAANIPWHKFEGRRWLREQYTKAWYRVSWDRYFDHFEGKLSGDTHVTGENSPTNQFVSTETLRRVKDEFGRRNIRTVPLFVMRDPVDRLYSNARYISMRSRTSRYKSDLGSDYENIFINLVNKPRERRYANCGQTLDNLKEVFGPNNSSIHFYENLFKEESIASICQALGLNYQPADFANRVNPSPVGKELSPTTIKNAVLQFKTEYEGVAKHFGWDSVKKFWPLSMHLDSIAQ